MKLLEALDILNGTMEKNTQLDLFNCMGHTLAQCYRPIDVNSWGINLNYSDTTGIIFELRFDSKKEIGKKQISLLESSEYEKHFIVQTEGNLVSYFCQLSISVEEQEKFIIGVLGMIYGKK